MDLFERLFNLLERWVKAQETLANAAAAYVVRADIPGVPIELKKEVPPPPNIPPEERERILMELERLGEPIKPRTRTETLLRILVDAKVKAGELPPDPTEGYRQALAREQIEKLKRGADIYARDNGQDREAAQVKVLEDVASGEVKVPHEEYKIPGHIKDHNKVNAKKAKAAAAAAQEALPATEPPATEPPATEPPAPAPEPVPVAGPVYSEAEARAALNNFFRLAGIQEAYKILEQIGGVGSRKFSTIQPVQYPALMDAMSKRAKELEEAKGKAANG